MALGTGRMKIRHTGWSTSTEGQASTPSDDERFTKDHISSVNQASYHRNSCTESHVSRKAKQKESEFTMTYTKSSLSKHRI